MIVGAIIEARSCERFFCLSSELGTKEPDLVTFYNSLLKSESRHFQGYLSLAEGVGNDPISDRIAFFLKHEKPLILQPDSVMRFHSGVPIKDS